MSERLAIKFPDPKERPNRVNADLEMHKKAIEAKAANGHEKNWNSGFTYVERKTAENGLYTRIKQEVADSKFPTSMTELKIRRDFENRAFEAAKKFEESFANGTASIPNKSIQEKSGDTDNNKHQEVKVYEISRKEAKAIADLFMKDNNPQEETSEPA